MKKIDKAVEIIRGWSDEKLKALIIARFCPVSLGFDEQCKHCPGCENGWNEEVEE